MELDRVWHHGRHSGVFSDNCQFYNSSQAKEIAKYDFPDATILRMKCDRCGGEYSYYFRVWGEDYIKERMVALHPDIQGHITDDMIRAINRRLWPEDDYDS